MLILKTCAHIQLIKYRAKIVGVTGSVGKTSATRACFLILNSKYKVLHLKEGYNSEIGLPLAILKQKSGFSSPPAWTRTLFGCFMTLLFCWESYDYILLEMGVDKPGDMRYLLSFIKPSIGIFLNVAPVHTEAFAKQSHPLEAIAKEKGLLITSLPAQGTAILNYDDRKVKNISGLTKAKIISFGRQPGCSVSASNIALGEKGLIFKVHTPNEAKKLAFPQILTQAYVNNFLAAIALGLAVGISLRKSCQALRTFTLPPGRLSLLPGIKDTLLIDGSYNASYRSMLAGLEALSLFTNCQKIAVLGDMRELGPFAKEEHEKLAQKAVAIADRILLVGPQMKKYFLAQARKLNYPADNISAFNSVAELIHPLENLLEGNEVILFKGSQNTIFLEIAVEHFLKDKNSANQILCRRGKHWEKIRRNYLRQTSARAANNPKLPP